MQMFSPGLRRVLPEKVKEVEILPYPDIIEYHAIKYVPLERYKLGASRGAPSHRLLHLTGAEVC
jgi:hypothetical protein